MQLWSASESAFVDLVDGYTYLPALDDQFMFPGRNETTPENLSIIMHEFTHQLSASGMFGLACAYHLATNTVGQILARFEAAGYLEAIKERLEDYESTLEDESSVAYFRHYSEPLWNLDILERFS